MIASLLTAQGLSGIIFLLFAAITIAGGVIATSARSMMRSVAGLAFCFLGVAGLYYFLESPYVAMMQLLIYAGAVCVVLVFAIMLADPDEGKIIIRNDRGALFFSILACAAIFCSLVTLACKGGWVRFPTVNDGSIAKIGVALLTTYSMSFELISVVLLVAIVGSLVLARSGRNSK